MRHRQQPIPRDDTFEEVFDATGELDGDMISTAIGYQRLVFLVSMNLGTAVAKAEAPEGDDETESRKTVLCWRCVLDDGRSSRDYARLHECT